MGGTSTRLKFHKLVQALGWLLFPALFFLCLWSTLKIVYTALWSESYFSKWLCRLVAMAYSAWLYYDRRTPFNGSAQRSKLLFKFFQPAFDRALLYFPSQLIFDFDPSQYEEELEKKPAIFACHPHGIFAFGVIGTFGMRCFPSSIFKKPHTILTIDMHFYIPFWRDLCILLGYASVGRASINALLEKNKRIVILVGGARESLDSCPGHMELTLLRRRGFFQIALQHGAVIFPTLTFGETETHHQLRLPIVHHIQLLLLGSLGFTIPLFYGKYGILPAPKTLKTVVGYPIIVQKITGIIQNKDVESLRELYIKTISGLYAKHQDITPGAAPTVLKIK